MGLVAQDGSFQAAEILGRLDAQLFTQVAAQVLVGPQRSACRPAR
jgi:hypothetical protein